ncbi:hypothetical protein GO495_19870 [Chitinophaga oryziterrae]|uniref:RiboL-PSP-HEPN domain-containing protein n=1 Tax=Chitinophaga oryziterrae TaxID=1031224 RepID=A0A6N8JCE3_9BACT|nr:hypothetical protein [Chitinophaga oryziterrae]MVT42863.1 hypothetical protein [Chitinophaga oryziterrae]
MANHRIKISASYADFIKEITRLQKFDYSNHQKFSRGELTKSQIILLVESIFFAGFRKYEGFLKEIFILYCLEKQSSKRPVIKSYLKPKDFTHCEELIKSGMPFLDWNSPDALIARAETFLENGHPIKLPYTANLQVLRDYKKLRNHIAHNSNESLQEFVKLVRIYYSGIIPLKIPTPGEYLMLSSKKKRENYLLLDFFDAMKNISADLI